MINERDEEAIEEQRLAASSTGEVISMEHRVLLVFLRRSRSETTICSLYRRFKISFTFHVGHTSPAYRY